MKLLHCTSAAIVACAALSACTTGMVVGQGRDTAFDGAKIDYSRIAAPTVTERQKSLASLFLKTRKALFADQECKFQSPTNNICVLPIPVILVPDESGNEYCVAIFPERLGLPGTTQLKPNSKKIVFWLVPTFQHPTDVTFRFFDDRQTLDKAPGIVVLKDEAMQMTGAGLGDGSVPEDTSMYHFVTKHDEKGKALIYLPLVVRTDSVGSAMPKVSVCATPDPIMVND